MRAGKFVWQSIALTIVLACAQAAGAQAAGNLDNASCLGCHGVTGFAAPRADGKSRPLLRERGSICRQRARQGAALRRLPYEASPKCRTRTWRKPPPSGQRSEIAIAKNCIACHAKAAQGYTETYHGQVIVMGFDRWRDLRRLPRQPRHSARQQSGLERGAGQSAEHLPQMPCRRDAGLRDVPAACHHRRLRALSLHVDRLEIRQLGGRRRAVVLLDPLGALVLS